MRYTRTITIRFPSRIVCEYTAVYLLNDLSITSRREYTVTHVTCRGIAWFIFFTYFVPVNRLGCAQRPFVRPHGQRAPYVLLDENDPLHDRLVLFELAQLPALHALPVPPLQDDRGRPEPHVPFAGRVSAPRRLYDRRHRVLGRLEPVLDLEHGSRPFDHNFRPETRRRRVKRPFCARFSRIRIADLLLPPIRFR